MIVNGFGLSDADIVNAISNIDADIADRARRAEAERAAKELAKQIDALPKSEILTPPNTASLRGFFVGMDRMQMHQQLRFLNSQCPPTGQQGQFGPCSVPDFGKLAFYLTEYLQPQQVHRIEAGFESAEPWEEVVKKLCDHFGVPLPNYKEQYTWSIQVRLSQGQNATLQRPGSGSTTWQVTIDGPEILTADLKAKDAAIRAAVPTPKF
jgi:hypothetical protein